MKKQMLCLLIACAMIFMIFCSCAQQPSQTLTAGTNELTDIAASDDTAEAEVTPDVPDITFDGMKFRVLVYQGLDPTLDSRDFYTDDSSAGEMIYEAVMNRDAYIEEKYKVEIEVTGVKDVVGTARKSISAGSDEYEMIMPFIDQAFSLAQDNLLIELHNVDYLDLSKPWWDKAIERDLAINGKLYFTTGSISVMDEELNMGVAFNKTLAAKNNINPYPLVEDKKWTFDAMYTLSKGITHDDNGDGKYDTHDTWGIGHSLDCAYEMFFGAGVKIASINAEGKPELTVNSSRAVAVMDKLCEIYHEPNAVGTVEHFGGWEALNQMMVDGKILFRPANIYNLRQYLQMVDEFGMLPMPMLDDEQDSYYHIVLTNGCAGVCIPSTNSDLEMTGILLEELSYYGGKVVTPKYYDSYIKYRVSTDEDTGRMFDIIFSTKTYDIGKVFGWGNIISSVITKTIVAGSGFASNYEAVQSSAQKALDTTYEQMVSIKD
ncbi:MAG: hypothetical protein VB118_11350 [Oscillospiraceae bacterium]|nr:hypothetical protein [Oscillospiraceae bacterium]